MFELSLTNAAAIAETIRTARSRTSCENLFCRAIAPSSQEMAPPANPGRFMLVNELLAGQFKTGMSDIGEHPDAAYPHARTVACLPAGGPTGEIFLHSEIFSEATGLRACLKGLVTRLMGR